MRSVSASALAGIAVAAVYAYRAWVGVPADRAFHRGSNAAAEARFDGAEEDLDRGNVGADRDDALWLHGEALLGLWDALPSGDRYGAKGIEVLGRASSTFLKEYSASPTSGWPTSGLGQVYARRERMSRATRTFDLAGLGGGPWAALGDDGRVAIGLMRLAIRREPNTATFRDRILVLLEANGLRDAARDAAEEAARVLPDFDAHPELPFDSLPEDLIEAFYAASRRDVGHAPLQLRERHLLSLGKLARRLGHLADSERDLREALASPGTALFHAEDAFHLATTLIDLARYDEARGLLERAWEFRVFRPAVLSARATIAERQGRLSEALDALSELRRLEPRDLSLCRRFAQLARRQGSYDRAEEALRWGLVLAPASAELRAELVRLYIDAGRRVDAQKVVDDAKALGASVGEVKALEEEMTSRLP